jgi:hydroxymethylpyrimidine/phosphomethylpyrimidine kinase
MAQAKLPVVLVIAGMDPSGGAGLVADIQTLTAHRVHPAAVTTAVTVQDTRNASAVEALDAAFVVAQARAILDDMPVAAIKLGLLANGAIGQAVAALLEEHADIPVVLDPVLVAGGGAALAEDSLVDVLHADLLPRAVLTTPNGAECLALAPQAADIDDGARLLQAHGGGFVLVTGGDQATPTVRNLLLGPGDYRRAFDWPRLPGSFHGSGCTLAAAATARIAQGENVADAAAGAQQYTFEALRAAMSLGRGQLIPTRSA